MALSLLQLCKLIYLNFKIVLSSSQSFDYFFTDILYFFVKKRALLRQQRLLLRNTIDSFGLVFRKFTKFCWEAI